MPGDIATVGENDGVPNIDTCAAGVCAEAVGDAGGGIG